VTSRRFSVSQLLLSTHLLLQCGLASAAWEAQAFEPRDVREVSSGWRFQIDTHDVGESERWYDPGADRSSWRDVVVPGAWDLIDESMRGHEGIGWYSVTIDGSWARAGKVQHLNFGRVMYHARVWLNGELLGEHVDGYLPFSFDVTGKLTKIKNELVVRVDNQARIEWLPAAKQIEWVQYGGILQPVRLESTARLFLSDCEIHAVPVGGGAKISFAVSVHAREDADLVSLHVSVSSDERSAQVVRFATRAGTTSRHEAGLTLPNAAPWSPESPVLYTLVALLERDRVVVDRLDVPFGVRTISAHGHQLLLNGKPLKVRGVNRYDEFGSYGPNPPPRLVDDELRLMKKAGINLIRSHYPQAPDFLLLCDRLGMLFLEELPINWWGVEWWGKDGVVQDEGILDRARPMLEAMVRRDRNHPSVIIWSMANESKTDNDVGTKVMRTLIRRTKELDSTRLVTFVTAPGSVRQHRAYEDADLVATNMYFGSLAEPHANHRSQLEERAGKRSIDHLRQQLAAFPDKPLLITEFGAMGFPGMRGDVPASEDFQADYLKTVWSAISAVPEVSGGVVWSWADYNHRRHFSSLGAFGSFGVVTFDRRPKLSLKALATMFGGSAE
jgi:beta-glucuronidase